MASWEMQLMEGAKCTTSLGNRQAPALAPCRVQRRSKAILGSQRRIGTASYRNYNENSNLPFTTAGTAAGESKKLADYLISPFDFLTFGPRLLTGVLLSTQEVANDLPSDIDRASSLLQGPGPQTEKQEILMKEVETRLAKFLQKGATLEADVLTAFADLLPEDMRRNMPPELKDVMLRGSRRVPDTPPTLQEAVNVPIATVAKNQTVAELEDLRNSIAELRLAIADLNANTDPAETAVLKINVRESRSSLAMRLQRLTPASLVASDVPLDQVRREAQILLSEAEALAV